MKFLISFLVFSLFLMTGCVTVQDTIYLQQIEVSTPLNLPPLNLSSDANEGKATFSPKFYINNIPRVEGTLEHSPVNQNGIFQVDTIDEGYVPSSNNRYPFSGRNLMWKLPDLIVGFDADIPVSDVFSINGGFNFSSTDNAGLLGGSLGLSIHKLLESSAIRLSGGITWQQFQYNAKTVVVRRYTPLFGREEVSAYFFNDTGKESEFNFYLSLLYNTNFYEFPLNFYAGVSYFSQSLFDFEPSHTDYELFPFLLHTEIDARGEYNGMFFNLSPGLFVDIFQQLRIVGGTNFVFGSAINNATKKSFILPFVKLEFFL